VMLLEAVLSLRSILVSVWGFVRVSPLPLPLSLLFLLALLLLLSLPLLASTALLNSELLVTFVEEEAACFEKPAGADGTAASVGSETKVMGGSRRFEDCCGFVWE
jgi:hypothetical protein